MYKQLELFKHDHAYRSYNLRARSLDNAYYAALERGDEEMARMWAKHRKELKEYEMGTVL